MENRRHLRQCNERASGPTETGIRVEASLFVPPHKSWNNGYAYRPWNLAEGVGVRDRGGDRGRGVIRRPLIRRTRGLGHGHVN